jgi:hypothetical protein
VFWGIIILQKLKFEPVSMAIEEKEGAQTSLTINYLSVVNGF